MKTKPMIFLGLVTATLCLIAPNCVRANGASSRSTPFKPQQYSNPDAHGGGIVVENGGSWDQGDTKSVVRDHPVPSGGNGFFTPDQNQYPAPVNKASSLIGMKVKNQNNETLGKIKDIVFDLQSGRVAYVVLEKAGRTHGTGANISVPLSAFTPSSDDRQLFLNANKSQVQTARGFSRSNYPPLGEPVYSAQATRERPREHIIVVPVPMSPEQLQDLNPQPDQPHGTNPDAISGLSSF